MSIIAKFMEAIPLNRLSIPDYLSLEAEHDAKYEYHDGTAFAMAGGTLYHGLICGNAFGEIRALLKQAGSSCTVMNSEVKLYIKAKNAFVYPDAMVVCGDIERAEVHPEAVTNPVVIIEVLSKTTASYDRGDKFHLYRQLNSLRAYLLIEQDKAQVEIYEREAGLWKITRVTGLPSSLPITALGISLSLEGLYQNVAIPD